MKYVVDYLAEDILFGPVVGNQTLNHQYVTSSVNIVDSLDLPDEIEGGRFDVLIVHNLHDAICHVGLLPGSKISQPLVIAKLPALRFCKLT